VSGYPMLQEYFRLSVGTPDENQRLLAALREIFEKEGKDRG
jgi:histidinol-phosphate/aromatic aminotransferase/cobyric acid decarboxylase-like protein